MAWASIGLIAHSLLLMLLLLHLVLLLLLHQIELIISGTSSIEGVSSTSQTQTATRGIEELLLSLRLLQGQTHIALLLLLVMVGIFEETVV